MIGAGLNKLYSSRLYPKAGQKTKGRVSFSQNFYQRKKEEKLTLPKGTIQVLRLFETVLSERVWEWAKVLVIRAILAPGERTVAAILRVMGCSDDKQFQNYHRGRGSCQMVESRTESPVAGITGASVCSCKRASDPGHR